MSNPFIIPVSDDLLVSMLAGLIRWRTPAPLPVVEEELQSSDYMFIDLMMYAAFAFGGVPLLRSRAVAA